MAGELADPVRARLATLTQHAGKISGGGVQLEIVEASARSDAAGQFDPAGLLAHPLKAEPRAASATARQLTCLI